MCPLGLIKNQTSCGIDPSYDGNPWVNYNSTKWKTFNQANNIGTTNSTKNSTANNN